MSNDLKLRVVFDTIDKMTRPLKSILSGSRTLSDSLKNTRHELAGMDRAQKNIAAFRELKSGLTSTDAKLHAAQARIKALAGAMQASASPSRQMTAEFKRAKQAAALLAVEHGRQSTRVRELRDQLAGASIDTRNLVRHERELRSSIAATTAKMDAQMRKLEALGEREKRLSAARRRMQATQSLAGGMAAAGATGSALGGGMLMGARSLLAPGVDFNAAMSKVQALGRLDANSDAFQALRAQSRQLGATTSFTATQAAEGQGFLAMAGFKPEQILTAMPSVLGMAKAGDTDLARTADISSNIMSGFGLDASQMPRVADVLTMTFTTSNTNLEMLGETMKYMGPVAKAAGMSLEQAAATAGLLGNAGIQSSQAGTVLRAMLLRLASPTSKAGNALKELGVASVDVQGNVRDIPSILRDVAVATEKMGSGQRLGYLKKIFGEEPAAGMAELIAQQGANGIDRYVGIIEASAGTTQRTAAIMADNLKGDLQTAQSAWQDFGITISDTVDGPLRRFTQAVTEGIRAVSQWAQRNPELSGTLAKVAMVLGGVLATFGVFTLTLAAVLGPLAVLRFSLTTLGVQGGVLRGVLGGLGGGFRIVGQALLFVARLAMAHPVLALISALAMGALYVWQNWESIGPKFAEFWKGLVKWFGTVAKWFWDIGANIINGLIGGFTGSFGLLKDAVVGAASAAVGWFKDKLGIHSPSRVFAELGGFVGQGAAQGITGERARVVKAVTGLATVAAASFGLPSLTHAAELPWKTSAPLVRPNIPIDSRPPLAANRSGTQTAQGSSSITIHVHPPAGADPTDIARLVRAELERAERAKQSRIGSRLTD